uniref:GTP binding protein 2 n=1 Tax=Naja naja TaxID=35670 RepID=A0A8C6YEL5_NAJNA
MAAFTEHHGNIVHSSLERRPSLPAPSLSLAEDGNIEYKLKLVNPSQYRFEHLVTQMKWRLQEGRGEAVYQIGVEDNGLLVGLSEEEMHASLKTLRRMAEKVGADITVLREREVDYDSDIPRKITEVLVRKVPDNQQFLDLRVAVLGNVDSGKSTLLGVLTQGELDNGRGRARLNLFRHLHEIQSGRTSSISFEILGFNSKGEVVNYSDSRTAEEICESSSKMITFIDLAGHHKYLKTTIFGLTSYCPDFAMLVVSANTGIAGTTREHLGLAMALKVPFFIVISKVDLCSKATVERTVKQLERILKQPGCNKLPLLVTSDDDAVTAAQQFAQSPNITPIFTLSSVSGENLDLLRVFLNILPPLTNSKEQEELMQQLTEFQVHNSLFSVESLQLQYAKSGYSLIHGFRVGGMIKLSNCNYFLIQRQNVIYYLAVAVARRLKYCFIVLYSSGRQPAGRGPLVVHEKISVVCREISSPKQLIQAVREHKAALPTWPMGTQGLCCLHCEQHEVVRGGGKGWRGGTCPTHPMCLAWPPGCFFPLLFFLLLLAACKESSKSLPFSPPNSTRNEPLGPCKASCSKRLCLHDKSHKDSFLAEIGGEKAILLFLLLSLHETKSLSLSLSLSFWGFSQGLWSAGFKIMSLVVPKVQKVGDPCFTAPS